MSSLSIEQRRSLERLQRTGKVGKIRIKKNELLIEFHSGVIERWILKLRHRYYLNEPLPQYIKGHHDHAQFHVLPPPGWECSRKSIEMYYEFERNPLYNDEYNRLKDFFMVRRDEWLKASFIETRLIVHNLIVNLKKQGWIDIQYPDNVLIRDKAHLYRDFKPQYNSRGHMVMHYGSQHAGKCLIEHFLPWGDCHGITTIGQIRTIKELWVDPVWMWCAINRLVKKQANVTRSAILRSMVSYIGGPRYGTPRFWASLYKKIIPVEHNVVIRDLSPGWGAKLLGATICGYEYHTDSSSCVEGFQEMAKFVGGNLVVDEEKPSNLVVLSEDPLDYDQAINLIRTHRSCAKRLFAIIKRWHADNVIGKIRPRTVFEVSRYPLAVADIGMVFMGNQIL